MCVLQRIWHYKKVLLILCLLCVATFRYLFISLFGSKLRMFFYCLMARCTHLIHVDFLFVCMRSVLASSYYVCSSVLAENHRPLVTSVGLTWLLQYSSLFYATGPQGTQFLLIFLRALDSVCKTNEQKEFKKASTICTFLPIFIACAPNAACGFSTFSAHGIHFSVDE